MALHEPQQMMIRDSFENGAPGWTLSPGAGIVKGSEPYGAGGSVGASSVNLPAGASVTSPFTILGDSQIDDVYVDPHMRY